MNKTILVTGATDGIGQLTSEMLVAEGHHVLIHGRNAAKLDTVQKQLQQLDKGSVDTYCADLSDLQAVHQMALNIANRYPRLDVVINNAGVYKTSYPVTAIGLDVRFVVNTLAPYVLSKALIPSMSSSGRILNVASAAQVPIDLAVLKGERPPHEDMDAYAQSKLALIMWSRHLSQTLGDAGPCIICVNPGSLLASKMVKDGFGIEGKSLTIGANILVKMSLEDTYAKASGRYFDNDINEFALPQTDALNSDYCQLLVATLDQLLGQLAP